MHKRGGSWKNQAWEGAGGGRSRALNLAQSFKAQTIPHTHTHPSLSFLELGMETLNSQRSLQD